MKEIKFRSYNIPRDYMSYQDEKGWLDHSFLGDNNAHQATTNIYMLNNNDSCALMQYTGLKDKSGKEIYEGDICTDHNQYNPQDLIIIEWRKAGFTGRYHNNNSYVSYIPDLACKKYLEVIGNIHENPELLK